tara:strand:- start:254 stop:382 length:129 start_codon:yes stop_codon:yes gene_type:complete
MQIQLRYLVRLVLLAQMLILDIGTTTVLEQEVLGQGQALEVQ